MAAADGPRLNGALLALLVTTVSILACIVKVSAARGTPASVLKSINPGDAAHLHELDNYTSIQGAFWAHQSWQTAALQQAATQAGPPPAVVAQMDGGAGLGNRLPMIVIGYLMALMTGRVFLLQPSQKFTNFFRLTLPSDWGQYENLYSNASRCTVSKRHWQQLVREGPVFCASDTRATANTTDPTLVFYSSIDYDAPLLQVNPTLAPYFKRLLPDGEVFHYVSRLLLEPTEQLKMGMLPYLGQANRCLVGLHLRHHKPVFEHDLRRQQFVGIARSLYQGLDRGNIFVASDKDVFEEIASLIGDKEVWWSNITKSEFSLHTVGGNPGTQFGAAVDLLLLSHCKHIIVTAGSSFGCVAAALGGVKPVYAAYGHHTAPFVNPWFWQSLTSEPCMYKAGVKEQASLGSALELLQTKHPLYYFHNQCHP